MNQFLGVFRRSNAREGRYVSQLVILSETAFFTIVTAAVECYKNPPGNGALPVETYGLLWGHEGVSRRNERILKVQIAGASISADGQPDSVMPHDRALDVQRFVVDSYLPELEYLGDFHSHPWDSENDGVKSDLEIQRNLLKMSSADVSCVRDIHEKHKETSEADFAHRLSLITTVFKHPSGVERPTGHISDDDRSCIRFCHAGLTVWIQAYAWGISDTEVGWRKVQQRSIELICPSLGIVAANI